jgi:hypothetical protein
MISLKSYCGPLSNVLDLTPDALYERQRVLVRVGYLGGAVAGKGPGSGIRASRANVAKLILSTLATDALSEIDEKTRKLAAVKSSGGKCPFTGETRFYNALEKILSGGELAEAVHSVEVRRSDMTATVRFKDPAGHSPYVFSEFGTKRLETGMALRITATIPGWGIAIISRDLDDIVAGAPLSNHTPFR